MRLLITAAIRPPANAVIPCGQENISISMLTCACFKDRKDSATDTPIQRKAHLPAADTTTANMRDTFFMQQYIMHRSAFPQAMIGTMAAIDGPTPINEAIIAEQIPIDIPQHIPKISENTNSTQLTRVPVIICDADIPRSGTSAAGITFPRSWAMITIAIPTAAVAINFVGLFFLVFIIAAPHAPAYGLSSAPACSAAFL